MKHYFRQAWRGMGTLPHVGDHPGTTFLLILVVGLSVHGGIVNGFWGAIGGFALPLVVFGPLYVKGSVDRANLCDKISSVKRK